MKILCFGSLNIDFVYRLPHFVKPGETIAAEDLSIFPGGKGLNQAIALSKGGADVYMAGAVGQDGMFLIEELKASGVDTSLIRVCDNVRTGNAIIQNDYSGDNSIILFGGANRSIEEEYIVETLSNFSQGDYIVLQNEINNLDLIIEEASKREMKIFFNPSPMEKSILNLPLEKIHFFILNEIEGKMLIGGAEETPDEDGKELADQLSKVFKGSFKVLTLGEKGSFFVSDEEKFFSPAIKVENVVDTTAAGDTFSGFLIAALGRGESPNKAMEIAAKAAAIAVSKKGAAVSIPDLSEIE